MIRPRLLLRALLAVGVLMLAGCATQPGYDYSAFRESRPRSILVLPPLNDSPDVNATYSMYAQTTLPLAESGYYVLPVTLVDEAFRQNGLTAPADIQQVPLKKLREIFGADAALYIKVTHYGTKYMIISSETRVSAEGKLVDLRSGATLWEGRATASSAEGDNNSGGGALGLLLKAVITQIADTLSNRGHPIAGITADRLLSAGRPNGILYGPRSPKYQKDGSPAP
ncbi:MAG: hypothetical protein RLZZ220_624 [Pseudomonadota bacterium]|jgi:hypothetical protein|uniref:Lipoprotein n=1 Tax=Zoogloea ramigera TaxID=350 RepID=A0A4Y4CTJ2_ZOORA|nr:DUF799 domain-containing protein [Zoogloea ramigera]MBP6800639.1 DUF799 domain-containing protein [Zoogloea sp.]MBP7627276.1 DUF799 domain-containing protein [Zoogloea sp.]GEC96275.1 lipoprotein [Zoogloea ramigera]